MTTPFPEPDSPALERFAVCSRVEVLALLHGLIEQGVLTNVYYDPDGNFFLARLLAVRSESEELVIDPAPDRAVQRRLLETRRLVFVTFVQGVKLQFGAECAEETMFDERPALRVRLPERVIRMQRREFSRVRLPASSPMCCRVRDAGNNETATLRVLDVSSGGLALAFASGEPLFVLGMELDDCQIEIPGEGTITAALRVRSIELSQHESEKRVGCEFVRIAPTARLALQRFINRADAEQRTGAADRASRLGNDA